MSLVGNTMKLASNGLQFEVDVQGPVGAPVVLLTMGLGMQMTAWPPGLLEALGKAGYRVIRYDNRDIGLSSHLDHLGPPNLAWQYVRQSLGMRVQAGYDLHDMALDALGLLDALDVRQAHLVGFSMGGMISQRMAATAGHRVLSLGSVMSSSGAPGLPGPSPAVTRTLMKRPRSRAPEDIVEHTLEVFRQIGTPGQVMDTELFRQHLLADALRDYHPVGVARQTLAIMADVDRYRLLQQIRCPALVLHGTVDPLVPIECGRDTARRIPGSRFVAIEGMGHDWPPSIAEQMAKHIVEHLNAAQEGRRTRS